MFFATYLKTTLAVLTLAIPVLSSVPAHAASASSNTKPAERYEYNFQSPYAGPHILNTDLAMPWLTEVQEKSHNRLKFNYFMSGALVRPEDLLNTITAGNLDMAGVSPQSEIARFPRTLTFMIPYIAKDSVQASELFWQAYHTVPEVKAELDAVGKILTVWGSDRSGFFSAKGPILSPADLKGKKVLIWTESQAASVKAWGATPVLVSSLDTRRALERGSGDVFFGPLPAGVPYKVKDVAHDVTILPSSSMLLFTVVSWNMWNELPADLQKLLLDTTGHDASVRSGKLLYDATNKDLAAMREEGVNIHTLNNTQLAAFRKADEEVTVNAWKQRLKELGVAAPDILVRQAYDMAATIPDAEGK